MTTQEMFDEGIHCRGRGFNCCGCKERDECVEYINMDVKEKPPIGIMPKYIWDTQRISNLQQVIERYTESRYVVPLELIEEYNELVGLYKERNV